MNTEPEAVIRNLTKLTQQKKLPWTRESVNPEYFSRLGERVDFFLETTHKGRHLRLYEVLVPDQYDGDKWDQTVRLEIIGDGGETLWRFPYSRWLLDLLAAALYQAGDIENVLGDLGGDAD